MWLRGRGSQVGLRRLLASLADGPAASVLGVHEHEGVTWFDRDGYRILLGACILAGLADSRSTRPAARAAALFAAGRSVEDRSGYRLDRLIEATAGAAKDRPTVPDVASEG